MRFLPDDVIEQMLTAADAVGATRVNVRCSWYHANVNRPPRPENWRPSPGAHVAYLRCNPAPCIELWTVADNELAADWEAVPGG